MNCCQNKIKSILYPSGSHWGGRATHEGSEVCGGRPVHIEWFNLPNYWVFFCKLISMPMRGLPGPLQQATDSSCLYVPHFRFLEYFFFLLGVLIAMVLRYSLPHFVKAEASGWWGDECVLRGKVKPWSRPTALSRPLASPMVPRPFSVQLLKEINTLKKHRKKTLNMCIKVIMIMIITFIIISGNESHNYVEGELFQSWIKNCEGLGDQHCVEASDPASTSEISEVFTLSFLWARQLICFLEHCSSTGWQQQLLPRQCWLSVMGASRWLTAASLASKAAATHSPSPGLCWRFGPENLAVHRWSKAFSNILDLCLMCVFFILLWQRFCFHPHLSWKPALPHTSVIQRPGLLGVFTNTQKCLIYLLSCSAPGEGLWPWVVYVEVLDPTTLCSHFNLPVIALMPEPFVSV